MDNFYLLDYDNGESGLYHNKYKALYELLQTHYKDNLKDDLHQLQTYLATLNDPKANEMLAIVNAIDNDLETYTKDGYVLYVGYVNEVTVMD